MKSLAAERILIYHIGSLGDTLVAIPAFAAIRRAFLNSRITLLHDCQEAKGVITARDVLMGSRLVDGFLDYPRYSSMRAIWLNPWELVRLVCRLRVHRFTRMIYLVRAYGGDRRLHRDRWFFRLAGIPKLVGMEGLYARPERQSSAGLPRIPQVGEQLLARLAAAGIQAATASSWGEALNLGNREEQEVQRWLGESLADEGRRWLGLCAGSKHAVNRWPEDRFIEVVRRAIAEFDLWPVVFGSIEDVPSGRNMIDAWRRGFLAAGVLSIRASAVALQRCRIFVGADSGPMHLAAAVGVPCVAVFSARNYPGEWFPSGGNRHRVIRHAVECEGCELSVCTQERMRCLLSIGVDEVWDQLKAALIDLLNVKCVS